MSRKLLTLFLLIAFGLMPVIGVLADDNDDADGNGVEEVEEVEDVEEVEEEEDSNVLVYGVPVTGEITDDAYTQEWILELESAMRLNLRVERTGGNLIPNVNVFDATGRPFGQNRGPDRSLAVVTIDRWDIANPGVYTLEVGRDRGESGVTTGTYSLLVTVLATGEDYPANTSPIASVDYDTPISGEITNTHWNHIYTLDAGAEDLIRVTAARASGTLLPEVHIVNAEGRSLRSGYVDDRGITAETEFRLPEAGQYSIVMTRTRGFGGFTEGEYELTVSLVGAGTGSSLLAGVAGTLEYGKPVTGSIGPRWYEDWELVTNSGDTITIVVERAPGATLQPEVALLGGGMQDMRRGYADDTAARASIERYALSVPGTYFIRVTRTRGQNGATSGDYTLTVHLDGLGAGNPLLAESLGSVTLKTPVEGTITNERWANVWMYNAEANEQLDIIATRTGGTLIPNIDIQDINGQSLRLTRAEVAGDTAQVAYRFPSTGQYRIVVLRADQQNGFTTGEYSLLLRPQE
jgi:hypothetical protein